MFVFVAAVSALVFRQAVIAIGETVFSLGLVFLSLIYLNTEAVRAAFDAGPSGRWMSWLNLAKWTKRKRWVPITLGILSVILIVAIFAYTLSTGIEGMFRSSPVYSAALTKAQESPCVVNKLARPIVAKGMIGGNFSESSQDGSAELSIPVEGPRANGELIVSAKKVAGVWDIRSLELVTSGVRNQIVPATTECH
jgi:hypothetical protein